MPSLPRFLTALLACGAVAGALCATCGSRVASAVTRCAQGRYRLTIAARAMVGGGTAKATTAFRIVR
jgi:hypothetical protein